MEYGTDSENYQNHEVPKSRLAFGKGTAAAIIVVVAIAMGIAFFEFGHSAERVAQASPLTKSETSCSTCSSEPSIELTPNQLNSIKVAQVGTHQFPLEDEAVGSIDFDEDLSVQVFPNYQGTIIDVLVQLGDQVRKDQPLYTIKSPDLIQAESTLIGAAATFELTSKELVRAKTLYANNTGIPERELEQATSDQQTAEGALKAARDAVRVFGKTDTEIDQMISSRRIDPALVVRSPISGKITAKNAQPGFLVQPGTLPAPYSVADVTTKWMLADIVESEIPLFHLGQPVQAEVAAFPGHAFKGKVAKIYATSDPTTHRVTIRSEIADPNDELRPGMLANFVIRVRPPTESVALPEKGVVREGDGTMTAWVTTDRRHFSQRVVKTGLRRDGQVQILEGLKRGELAVTDGAIFLSNMLQTPPSD